MFSYLLFIHNKSSRLVNMFSSQSNSLRCDAGMFWAPVCWLQEVPKTVTLVYSHSLCSDYWSNGQDWPE